jgi:uncharacterized protein (TIGR03435 family)
VLAFQVVGGPAWLKTERFDIEATAPSGDVGQLPRLVQRLLEERFALKVRRETRQLPVLLLVAAQPDGGRGPNVRPVTTSCRERREKQQTPCRMSF